MRCGIDEFDVRIWVFFYVLFWALGCWISDNMSKQEDFLLLEKESILLVEEEDVLLPEEENLLICVFQMKIKSSAHRRRRSFISR